MDKGETNEDIDILFAGYNYFIDEILMVKKSLYKKNWYLRYSHFMLLLKVNKKLN